MKKAKYYNIEMEIIRFDNEDIITESTGDDEGQTPPNDDDF